MTDQRFKELLNLYLDHRLDGPESLEFEQALRADAGRRKTLRDYSLIQGCCAELFTRSAAQAPSSAALCRSLRSVESRIARANERETGTWSWLGWSSGMGLAGVGLAACATVFVVLRTGGPVEKATVQRDLASASQFLAEAKPVVIAVAAVSTVSVAAMSETQKARNLTLAALGLTGEDPAAARTGKHWAEARETYELANLSPSARSWIMATSAAEGGWTRAQTTGLTMQSGASVAWPDTSSSYVEESTGFRIER